MARATALAGLDAERAADGVAAERQRQLRGLLPPLAEVHHLVQAERGEQQLAFVDEQAGVDAARLYGVDDLVEGNHDGFELRLEKAQGQIGRSAQAGHGDAAAGEFAALHGLAGDDDRAVAVAEAGAAIEQDVFLVQEGVGGKADGRDVVGLLVGGAVERFDVGQDVRELEPGRLHPVGGQGIEHEGVVGIRRMRQLDFHRFRGGFCRHGA